MFDSQRGENRIGTNKLNNFLEINLMKQTRSRLPEDNDAMEFRRAQKTSIF